jgi:hypothetical protein
LVRRLAPRLPKVEGLARPDEAETA